MPVQRGIVKARVSSVVPVELLVHTAQQALVSGQLPLRLGHKGHMQR